MEEFQIKRVMDQVHISSEMQEDIIANVQNRMEKGKKGTWKRKKTAALAAAAALMLAAGIVALPIKAAVESIVRERMEGIPEEELQDTADMIQAQEALADGFSREYSDREKARSEELWQAYENGTFPEGIIMQVDDAGGAPEGVLCYDRSAGIFYLPEEEMTDEELLQIIDFQHRMEYAVLENNAVTEEEKAAYRAEEERKRAIVREAGGISAEEAIEIGERQLASDLGEKAASLELMTDRNGDGAMLMDVSDEEETGLALESRAGVAYDVSFGDPDTHDVYGYLIDAVDGSILYTWK